MRRWYNCWLRHAWTRWSDPKPGTCYWVMAPSIKYDTTIQHRTCEVCGKVELREVA